MSDALEYAIKIIENYEMDIRAAIADGRLPAGYCQGEIFKDAIADIKKRVGAEFSKFARKSMREGWHGDPEMQSIADEATEHQILALAALGENWRVNKDSEEWFAEKPCDMFAICGTCFIRHCEHCVICHGTSFMRAGKKP